jgi:dihydrofolate reductase
MRPFHLIVSCSENLVIGRAGLLPWSIPEDQRFFHAQTAGQIVLMGRVCFQTWPGAVTAGRRAVLVSSHPLDDPGRIPTAKAPDFPSALAAAEKLDGDIYICGGERVYREAMAHPDVGRLYLTLVHARVEGDTHFPEWKERFPTVLDRRDSADANWRYSFLTLGR